MIGNYFWSLSTLQKHQNITLLMEINKKEDINFNITSFKNSFILSEKVSISSQWVPWLILSNSYFFLFFPPKQIQKKIQNYLETLKWYYL